MRKRLLGAVHGKTIELAEDLGLTEGQRVEVIVKVVSQAISQPGDGFLRSEGALADDPYWDGIMEEVHQARKEESRTAPSETHDAGGRAR